MTPKELKVEELLSKATRLDNGCLICHLKPNAKGYSPVGIGGRNGIKYRAHRLVYEVKKGPISADLMVLHSCDVRNCIEPVHLFAGTAKDNTDDMMQKNRGRNGGKTKVTEDMFQLMKELRAEGYTNVAIGLYLGVSNETVRAYLNGTFTFS